MAGRVRTERVDPFRFVFGSGSEAGRKILRVYERDLGALRGKRDERKKDWTRGRKAEGAFVPHDESQRK